MRRACAAERRSRGLGDIAANLPPGADGYRQGVTLERFDLGREAADSGEFVRQDSSFRDAVSADGSTGFPAAAGRYHLYVARACPWAHRTLIVRTLKGLEGAIDVSYAHPYRDDRGWAFPGGDHVDQLNGFDLLS
jgi:glutathionyl-hydroquinone reductase